MEVRFDVGREVVEVRAVEATCLAGRSPGCSRRRRRPGSRRARMRRSSCQPSSNSWLPTLLTSRPSRFIASMVGSSWKRPESSGDAPIRSPAATVSWIRPSSRPARPAQGSVARQVLHATAGGVEPATLLRVAARGQRGSGRSPASSWPWKSLNARSWNLVSGDRPSCGPRRVGRGGGAAVCDGGSGGERQRGRREGEPGCGGHESAAALGSDGGQRRIPSGRAKAVLHRTAVIGWVSQLDHKWTECGVIGCRRATSRSLSSPRADVPAP